jgi:hypothetical protein
MLAVAMFPGVYNFASMQADSQTSCPHLLKTTAQWCCAALARSKLSRRSVVQRQTWVHYGSGLRACRIPSVYNFVRKHKPLEPRQQSRQELNLNAGI